MGWSGKRWGKWGKFYGEYEWLKVSFLKKENIRFIKIV